MKKMNVVPIHLNDNSKVLYQMFWILIYSIKMVSQELEYAEQGLLLSLSLEEKLLKSSCI